MTYRSPKDSLGTLEWFWRRSLQFGGMTPNIPPAPQWARLEKRIDVQNHLSRITACEGFPYKNVKIKLLKHTIYSYWFTSWGTVHPDKISSSLNSWFSVVPCTRWSFVVTRWLSWGWRTRTSNFVVDEEWFADMWVVFHSWILQEIYRVELPWEHGVSQ